MQVFSASESNPFPLAKKDNVGIRHFGKEMSNIDNMMLLKEKFVKNEI